MKSRILQRKHGDHGRTAVAATVTTARDALRLKHDVEQVERQLCRNAERPYGGNDVAQRDT